MTAGSRLRLIARVGIGLDNVDLAAARRAESRFPTRLMRPPRRSRS
jgi:phosphoglycerate dehydrogenase-like enzyme